MKKKYNSPYLIVEAFQLDTGVASCSGDGGTAFHYADADCVRDNVPDAFKAAGYFAYGACDDDVLEPVPGTNDQICYHGPLGDKVFFAS